MFKQEKELLRIISKFFQRTLGQNITFGKCISRILERIPQGLLDKAALKWSNFIEDDKRLTPDQKKYFQKIVKEIKTKQSTFESRNRKLKEKL